MDDDVENEGKSGKKNTIIIIIKSVVYRVSTFAANKRKTQKKVRSAVLVIKLTMNVL